MTEQPSVQKQHGLMERAQMAWAAFLGKQEAPKPDPIGYADASRVAAMLGQYDEAFALNNDRASRYADFQKMDRGFLRTILDQIVDSALTFDGNSGAGDDILAENRCFKVEIDGYGTSGPAQVIRQVLRDTELRTKMRQYAREVLRIGDKFVELLVDDNYNIVGLVGHKTEEMVVQRDNKARLLSGVDENGIPRAYRQMSGTNVVAGWYPTEMLHLKYFPVDESAYSAYGFLDGYRDAFRRWDWTEQSLVVARNTRSVPRYKHLIDTTGKSVQEAQKQLKEYVRAFTTKITPSGAAIKRPLAVDEDLFLTKPYRTLPDNSGLVPSLSDIELLDPRADGFANTNDITMLLDQFFDKVPKENLGLSTRQTVELTGQDIQYSAFIKNFQQYVLEDQLARRVIDMALALKGYNPKNVKYSLVWPAVLGSQSWKWADAQFRKALAFRAELEAKATNRVEYLKQTRGYSEEQALAVLARYKEEEKEFGSLSPADKSAQQVAGNASASLDRAVDDLIKEATNG